MFKKFMLAIATLSLFSQPALAGKFGGGSYSSGSSYRPSSSYQSTYRPTVTSTAPRFSSGPTYNTARSAQTTVVTRTNGYYSGYRSAPVVNNHYYGGGGYHSGYGGGYGGGVFSSPFFWMWAMDHHNQQQPVYVNGGQQPYQSGATGNYGPQAAPQDSGPGFFGMIFWGIVNLLIFVVLIALIIWGIRKLITLFR